MTVAAINQREARRLELQERLDAAKTQAERNRLGQFATPPALAVQVVEHAASLLPNRSRIRFLDPGFGTGSFYSALMQTLPPSRIAAAAGYEVDPHYGSEAQRLWKRTGLRLHIEDFTRACPPESESERFNFVICNPPYVRHHHLSQDQKQELRAKAARDAHIEMNGLSGLYTYFMVLSKAWMTAGGVAAWLIPSEFMDVNYGRQVKRFLLEQVTLLRIHRFDPNEVQFGDALVSSAVVFFRNTVPGDNHRVEFSFGGTIAKPTLSGTFAADELRQVPKWTGLPRRGATASEETLASLFKIKRGLATGCNNYFVLSREVIEQRALPQECFLPILPSPRYLEASEIAADRHGVPQIAKRLYLLGCNLPEPEVRRQYPSLWKYLEEGVRAGIHERYLCRHRQPWYSQEERPPAPLLCTYMGRPTKRSASPFRFILNHSLATATNLYLMLYPRPSLAVRLRETPELLRALWQALSTITPDMLTGEGRIYGGGLYKIEPKELANVPAEIVLKALPRECRQLRQHTFF